MAVVATGMLVLCRVHSARVPVARTLTFERGRATSTFLVAFVENADRTTLHIIGTTTGTTAAHVVLTAQGYVTG